MHRKKYSTLYIAIIAFIFILTSAFHGFIRPAWDDFYYMTFTDNGVAEYFNASVEHYNTLTGRAFVHFLLCPLLSFDMIPFKIWNTVLIVSLAFVAGAICKNNKKTEYSIVAFAFSLFWLTGISVLSDGALWGAGSFNYLFPAFMVVLYYHLFSHSLSGKTNYLVCILGFLSGATVEMTGILAICAVIYCALTNINTTKEKKTFVASNFISCTAGYTTLFLSAGIAKRLSQNDYQSIGVIERVLTNFSQFCRRICSAEGLSVLLIITFLLMSIYMIKQRKKVLCCLCFLNIISLTFTSLNIVYDCRAICIISVVAFLTLCVSSVCFFQKGNRTVMFCMLCVTVSLGICMISPVMAYRMLMPTAVFLIIISTQVLELCNLSSQSLIATVCSFAILASCTIGFYTHKFSINAKTIDENTSLTENYDQSGSLSLTSVPDEIYSSGTVPSLGDFGGYYLAHNNIPTDTDIIIHETVRKDILNGNAVISSGAILRNNIVYIPIRTVTEVIKADVSWILACAHVETEGKTYRFCVGAKAADTGLFFSPSIKLFHPVRMVSGTTYISLTDFNNIFGTDLKISD